MPVKFPAEIVEEAFEEFAAVDMHEGAFAGNHTFEVAITGGAEVISGAVSVAFGAVAGDDEARINDGADKRSTFVDELLAAFVGMEGEV